ncbi:MAG: ABC transporter permease [Dehalococcoidales bacterium]
MRNTWLIAGKEFRSHLTSPMAYVVVGIFLLLTGFFFTNYLTSTGLADTSIRGFVEPGAVLLLLFASILTMRLMAEEKKLGTWELLLTAPVRDTEVVLGKFLGTLGVLVAMLVFTLYYPILLLILGDPDIGPIIASYLGLFLVGNAALAIGLFASSLTSNQIVAAVVSGAILFGLWFVGLAASYMAPAIGRVITYISLSSYFGNFVVGLIDTRAIVYYLSVTALFLFLTIRSLETSRWN